LSRLLRAYVRNTIESIGATTTRTPETPNFNGPANLEGFLAGKHNQHSHRYNYKLLEIKRL